LKICNKNLGSIGDRLNEKIYKYVIVI
jgi:hypothetical protein